MNELIAAGFAAELMGLPLGAIASFAVCVWASSRWWTGGAGALVLVGPVLAALLPTALGAVLLATWPVDDEGLRRAVLSFGALRLLVWLGPAQVLWFTAAVGAWSLFREEGPRRWSRGLPITVAGVVAAGVVVAGGWRADDLVFASIRAAAYLALLLPVGLACVSSATPGRGAATWAAPLLPLGVALGEASQRGLRTILMLVQVDNVTAAQWAEAVDWFTLISRPTAQHAAVALAVASLGAAVHLWRGDNALRVGGFATVVVAWLVWGLSDLPDAQQQGIAALCLVELPTNR